MARTLPLGSFFSLFSSDLAIDLGTANTCVYARGKGIVVNEPSIVAINKINGRVEAVGKDAKEMLGRTPGNIVAIKPMKDGVIADFEVTEKMLTYFIKKAHNRNVWVRPRIVIGVPSEITQVEKRAVKDSAYRAKASEVHLVEEAMAAAIGAGMPITEPSGNMIVDIGGGTTDIAVISLAGIVYSKAVRVAGNEMDEAIIQYIKKTYNLLIGERTAEQIKMEIGSAFPLEEKMTMEIKGRHLIEGVPKTITITRRRDSRGAGRNGQRHRRRGARGARAHAAGAVGRHRRSRHRADRRRLAAEEPRQAAARGNRPAAGDGRRSAVVGRARRRQDAVGLQPAAEDLDRLRPGPTRPCSLVYVCVHGSCSTSDSAPAGCSWPSSVGHIILISAQVNTRRGVPVLEAVTFGVFAEVQRAATSAIGGVRDGVAELLRAAGDAPRERAAASRSGAAPESACSRSARWRSSRARCRSCSTCESDTQLTTTGGGGHRRRRQPRLPDDDHRQGNRATGCARTWR